MHTMLGISHITGNDYLGLFQKHFIENTKQLSLYAPTHSIQLSYLVPTWLCLSYRLSQPLTAAFFYGFSIQRMFLSLGWAGPTTACLATDHNSSPTAAPTWMGKSQKPLQGLRVTNPLSLSQECMFGRITPNIFQIFNIINA